MEQKDLTFRQRIAYAHWSAKCEFELPFLGCKLMIVAAVVYVGVACWFIEPILSWFQFSGPHAVAKYYISFLGVAAALCTISFLTAYLPFFCWYLFKNDNDLDIFLNHFYHKH